MISLGAPAAIHASADPLGDARWADEAGLEAVWFVDHHQGWFPRGIDGGVLEDPHATLDPFPLMGAAAAQTERVTIGISVTDLIRRPPPVVLQGALSISWLGRRPMILGLGAGTGHNLMPYGLDPVRRVAFFEQAVASVAQLRDGRGYGDPFVGAGTAAEVQLWLAANGPRSIDIAARFAEGWLPAGMPPRAYAKRLALLRERAEAHGRDPGSIRPAYFTWAVLAETSEESRELLEHPSVRACALYRGNMNYMPSELEGEGAMQAIEGIPTEVVESFVLSGSLDEVSAKIDEYEQAGCEHLIVYDIGRFVHEDGVERSRRCLAQLAGVLA